MPSHESGNEDGDANKYRQMFKLRVLHLMAFFILIYVGVEVTLGGAQPQPSLLCTSLTRGAIDRLDRHVRHSVARWRTVLRIHLLRILWW